jgi:ribonuclease HI
MQESRQQFVSGQSSSEPDGNRKIWQLIWKASVPPKVRVFAWRAATGSLGVLEGLHRRINTINPICSICGREVEDTHHALIRYTLARALRDELRNQWTLPPEVDFLQADSDWLFTLLSNSAADVRAKIIFLLWRAWHHRNNVIHGDGKASITASVQFLVNYQSSFAAVSPGGDEKLLQVSSWKAPSEGKIKANVDAGWDAVSKQGGVGIVIRDHRGRVILTEWKIIPFCSSAEEAEVIACLDGLRHLVHLRQWPAILESDCLYAVQSISSVSVEQSSSWAIILEAREILKVYREIVVSKVDRVSNGIAHVLAQLGKAGLSGSLSNDAPECVRELLLKERL